MPTVMIDHAINIPTRQSNVWNLLRDLSQNPKWQVDSQRIQFLSSSQAGRSTRWRSTTAKGKEQVIEILAWYEGLGYEYRIVDGAAFDNSRGRIRLQEAPEGTIVQWTFSYEVKGFMGSLQNSLGAKRHFDDEIVQGLRNLYTAIKESKADEPLVPEESKSYLKEAPDVEERAKYQPRHPSALKAQELGAVPDADAPYKPPKRSTGTMPLITEPPVAEDDTRPNAHVQPEAPQPITAELPNAPARPTLAEPDFLQHMPQPLSSAVNPVPAPLTAPKPEEETAAAPPPIPTETEAAKALPQASLEPLSEDRDASKLDTSQISVFELFGLPKPSETEKVRTLNDEPAPPAAVFEPKAPEVQPISEPAPSLVAEPLTMSADSEKIAAIFHDKTPIVADVEPEAKRRTGLRANLRQRLAPVRLPKSEA